MPEQSNLCKCCGKPRPLDPPIIGIAYDTAMKEPVAIEYRCRCGEPCYIPWPAATDAEREQAYLAEMSREAASEVMCR